MQMHHFYIPLTNVGGSIVTKIISNNFEQIEMFYLNSTLKFGIPPVLVFQLEVYYKVDRLLTGLTAQQKGTTARWYSNKTSLSNEIQRTIKIFRDVLFESHRAVAPFLLSS